MQNVKVPTDFTQLSDGTLLLRQADGTFRPVASETDHARLAALTDEEIEEIAANDPDHPALDDAFWAMADAQAVTPSKEAVSIRLDQDVLSYFRRQGQSYQTRINSVLRRYMEATKGR